MTQKLAVAIMHGIGSQRENYADAFITAIRDAFKRKAEPYIEDPEEAIVIEPVYWADVFEEDEDRLYRNLVEANDLHYKDLRRFVIHFLADAIAYQPVETIEHNYERVHEKVGGTLTSLAEKAGPRAPLCMISHSLGSVIAANFLYDLQYRRERCSFLREDAVPIEKGDTLMLFFTMGSPLPLWSLRYNDFARPIRIPSPVLRDFYERAEGQWLNFYDRDDILGYPLKTLNEEFSKSVTEDFEINAGNLLRNWNPASHYGYLKDKDVIEPIADQLIRAWQQVNNYV
ncbi:chemotaxis protein [Bacillus marinisedimentorum]|uniref:chemotaxis protein n=1 Tax=Bacillus marinisedimentorum TaxID=1821260 RepID=UPI0007E2576F|nr:chemotaxis protein [Bacillus marinisedimentorum]